METALMVAGFTAFSVSVRWLATPRAAVRLVRLWWALVAWWGPPRPHPAERWVERLRAQRSDDDRAADEAHRAELDDFDRRLGVQPERPRSDLRRPLPTALPSLGCVIRR